MCISPSFVWVLRGPAYEQQAVPCRHCWRCLSNRVNDYVGRCLAEASTSDSTLAITLTYRDAPARDKDLAHKYLQPRHAQDFIRALRKRGHSVRYITCGEYGSLRGRAHFHCILFFKGKPLDIPLNRNVHISSWPWGHVFADGAAEERSVRYVCKYILKGDRDSQSYLTMSKKPPLGDEWFRSKALRDADLGVMPSSFEYLPPGGHRGRPYLMTGATRRNYLAIVADAMAARLYHHPEILSEWVAKGLDKVRLWRHVREARNLSPEYLEERLLDDLRAMRPSDAVVYKILFDTAPNIDFDYWEFMADYWRNIYGTRIEPPPCSCASCVARSGNTRSR